MDKKTYLEKRSAILAEAANLEGAEYDAKMRELDNLTREFTAETAVMQREAVVNTQANRREINKQMRELCKEAKSQNREIIVGTAASPGAGLNSDAIAKNIHELVLNLEEGTTLPSALGLVTGVVGTDVFPTDASDMEIEEAGEIEVLNDQVIDFDNVKADPNRVTLSCDVSNKMIDQVNFDILAHVTGKFQKAMRKYWAKKVYSQANWAKNKGGFANAEVTGNITLNENAAANILAAIAAFVDKGFSTSSLCLTIDAVTEARLKTEPIKAGECAGFIIQNGKLLGYDYTVSHYINTALGGDAKVDASHSSETTKLFPTTDRYLGIGFYEYLKRQQHGETRLTFDGTSKAQAKKNCVGITLNTELSLTNLSNHIYDADGNAVNAFAVYKFVEGVKGATEVKVVNTDEAPVKTSGNVKVTNTDADPVKTSGSVKVTNTTSEPVNTKEVPTT